MARVPLVYPKMPGPAGAGTGRCVAFEKSDGTNLHWMWTRGRGWHAFGTRRSRFDLGAAGVAAFDAAHPGLPDAADLFRRDLAGPLGDPLAADGCAGATVFTEYLGDRSFAGTHAPGDPKRLVLFDVLGEGGFVPPERFMERFAGLPTARVVYRGPLTGAFTEDVRRGRYDVREGVVCKGGRAPGAV